MWLHFHKPELAKQVSSYKQRLFDYGHGVGKRATDSFPDGILIDIPRENGDEAVRKTRDELSKNPKALFEGAFIFNDVLVRVDILENNNDGTWNLIEVKSSKNIKPNPHYYDLGIQKWVLTSAGIQIKNSYLMIPTRGYLPQAILDGSGKFIMVKLDQEISDHMNDIEENIRAQQLKLNTAIEPIEKIGDRCKRPYECEFKNYCWKQARS